MFVDWAPLLLFPLRFDFAWNFWAPNNTDSTSHAELLVRLQVQRQYRLGCEYGGRIWGPRQYQHGGSNLDTTEAAR
jgi:hypothetical protein